MPAMVCVVQIGSSVRTSACNTARNTLCCAWTAEVAAALARAIAIPIPARINKTRFHKHIDRLQDGPDLLEYARRSTSTQYALGRWCSLRRGAEAVPGTSRHYAVTLQFALNDGNLPCPSSRIPSKSR